MRKSMWIPIAVCMFCVLILGGIALLAKSDKKSDDKPQEVRQEQVSPDAYYYAKSNHGYITIYYADGKTVFEETSIPVEEVPEKLQKELTEGKKLDTIGQVYGFLENYSS